MADKKKAKMTVKEFRESGLLQEVNRRFLHPMGLALSTVVDSDDPAKEECFGEISDFRDDPEGMVFCDLSDADSVGKFDRVEALFEGKRLARMKELGFHVQPIGNMRANP